MSGGGRSRALQRALLLVGGLATATIAVAQTGTRGQDPDVRDDPAADATTAYPMPLPTTSEPVRIGRGAETGAGEVGRRRGEEVADRPLARLDTRVANRVQSRLRTRIDRYYDPQANTTSPFVVAGEQAEKAQRPRR